MVANYGLKAKLSRFKNIRLNSQSTISMHIVTVKAGYCIAIWWFNHHGTFIQWISPYCNVAGSTKRLIEEGFKDSFSFFFQVKDNKIDTADKEIRFMTYKINIPNATTHEYNRNVRQNYHHCRWQIQLFAVYLLITSKRFWSFILFLKNHSI
jgi:hypothetical protein